MAKPLVGVVVNLTSDTKKIIKTTTDSGGRFKLGIEENSRDNNLMISYLGYADYHLSLENTQKDTDLGVIKMSPSTQEVKEVEVVAKREIQKIDRKIIIPSKLQLKASTNGLMLLKNMQLSGINVNTINNSVTTSTGGSVQLRINGVKAQYEDIKALHPQDIVKVEHHDMPGMRFADADAVIDFIVKYKNAGGNFSGDFSNSVSMLGYGENNLSANYHKGKSELKTTIYWKRIDVKWNRENYEEYHYGNQILENKEIGEPTKVKFDNMIFSLWYNYTFKKSIFSVIFRDRYDRVPNSPSNRVSTLYRENAVYHINDLMSSHENAPSLNLYLQTELPHQQHIYLDLIGTYINSKSDRRYNFLSVGHPDQEIVSFISGNKYSLIGEGIYEKTIKKSKLSFGLKHTQMYTYNTYDGNIESITKMNTAQTYVYSEWLSKIGNLSYSVGLGGMYIYNHQGDSKLSKFIFRPKLSLAYKPVNNITIRYQGYISGYTPSLSDMSNIVQNIDIYQLKKGNPDLKSVTFVSNSLSTNWGVKWFDLSWYGKYSCDYHPAMEETFLENNKFVRTMDNQKRFHRFNTQVEMNLHPFGEWFSLHLSPFFNRYISNGNHYVHTYSNWGLGWEILAMYKSWVFSAGMRTSYHNLWGETLTKGEANQSIALGYNRDKWAVQLIIANPFTNIYKSEHDNFSQLAPNRELAFSKNLRRFLVFNFSFNLNYGKSKASVNKRITNSDNESGIMHGR